MIALIIAVCLLVVGSHVWGAVCVLLDNRTAHRKPPVTARA